MRHPALGRIDCPHCGAKNPEAAAHCDSCAGRLAIYIGPAPALPRRVNLGTLMALIALVAVGLAFARVAIPAGLLIWFITLPALLRTATAASVRELDGRPLQRGESLFLFGGSACLMILVIVAGLFAGICTAMAGHVLLVLLASMLGGTYHLFVYVGALCLAAACGLGLYSSFRVLRAYWTDWD